MTFRVGQEVVCIDNSYFKKLASNAPEYWPTYPELKTVYHVRAVIECPFTGERGLYLKEIVCGINPLLNLEHGWMIKNFRPLVKTDISIFTAMLAPSPKKRVEA